MPKHWKSIDTLLWLKSTVRYFYKFEVFPLLTKPRKYENEKSQRLFFFPLEYFDHRITNIGKLMMSNMYSCKTWGHSPDWTARFITLQYTDLPVYGKTLLCLCPVKSICDVWVHKEILDWNNALEFGGNCAK